MALELTKLILDKEPSLDVLQIYRRALETVRSHSPIAEILEKLS